MKIIALISVSAFFVFTLIHFLGKIKKPFKRALFSVVCGPIVLFIVNLLSSYTSVIVPITQLSLSASIALGVPGVALMTLLTVIL